MEIRSKNNLNHPYETYETIQSEKWERKFLSFCFKQTCFVFKKVTGTSNTFFRRRPQPKITSSLVLSSNTELVFTGVKPLKRIPKTGKKKK